MVCAVDPSWTSEELAHELCDALVAKGQLKEKPTFIRTDREAKIASIFAAIGLDGAKMGTFENPGPLEMVVRKGTNGEAWVNQALAALVAMLPEEVGSATKKMGLDDQSKEELIAAKEKSAVRRERLEAEREEQQATKGESKGKGKSTGRPEGGGFPRDNGDRDEDRWGGGKGGGYNARDRDGGDREAGGGRFDRPESGAGNRRPGGGGAESMECFNCGEAGHSSRDCTEPRKEKGRKGGGKRDRADRQCLNCKGYGHLSRDCPEPPDEDAVRARLAAKAAKEAN